MTPEEAKYAEILSIMGFGENKIYDVVMQLLNDRIEISNIEALSRSTKGEDRIHCCGVADGLIEFRAYMEGIRQQARMK